MNSHREIRTQLQPTILASAVVLGLLSPAIFAFAADPEPAKSNAPAGKPMFDKTGPQVGDQLPDLKLRTLKGEPARLSDAWHGGPALLVTSSFTCPKSRSRWPELKALAEKYDKRLNVVVVYVIEAHPVGSVCPYKGVEEVTPENQRDGILRHQPKTLADRLDLAKEFERYLRVEAPIYVDTIDNQAWKAFGAAPNKAFLVDSQGIVVARQGWFDGPAMQEPIDELLRRHHASEENAAKNYRIHEEKLEAMEAKFHNGDVTWAIRDGKLDALRAAVKSDQGWANFVFRASGHHHGETTMLMEAVQARSLPAAELLLASGADANARTVSFDSALQVAAKAGEPEMVKLLLKYHAEVSFPPTGKTPLHEALLAGNAGIARTLIEAGAKEDFYSDLGLGKTDRVRAALAADPSLALRPDGASRSPLNYAAANGQLKVARLLIDGGAPAVDDAMSHKKVPLHYAIDSGSPAMVQMLLDAGHSPDTSLGFRGDAWESTPPLHMAINANRMDILKVLLAHKPDLDNRDTYSQTALHHAALFGKADFVEALLKAGADPNAKALRFDLPCGSGEEEHPIYNTPLHFAAAEGNPATIKALLKGGAKIDAANAYGITPLMSTIVPPLYTGINEETQQQNLEQLLASGADVNIRDKEGETVLDMANAKLKSDTPFTLSPERKRVVQAMIDSLLKHGAKAGEPKKQK